MISCKSWEDAIIPPSASLETAKKLTFLRENSDFIYPRLKERFVEIVREFDQSGGIYPWDCQLVDKLHDGLKKARRKKATNSATWRYDGRRR